MAQSKLIQSPGFELEVENSALSTFAPYAAWFCEHAQSASRLAETSALAPLQLLLRQPAASDRLQLLWKQANEELKLEVTCATWIANLQRGQAAKKGPLNQALGKKTRTVFDASGGWGNDALLFAHQGLKVVSAERHPLMAMMLHQAMRTLSQALQRQALLNFSVPQIEFGKADTVYAALNAGTPERAAHTFDCVYFDPMFPPKRNKAAKSNKQMQFAQGLLHGDPDASATAAALLAQGVPRLVVKRPHYADPLLPRVNTTFTANLVNYDVYLKN